MFDGVLETQTKLGTLDPCVMSGGQKADSLPLSDMLTGALEGAAAGNLEIGLQGNCVTKVLPVARLHYAALTRPSLIPENLECTHR